MNEIKSRGKEEWSKDFPCAEEVPIIKRAFEVNRARPNFRSVISVETRDLRGYGEKTMRDATTYKMGSCLFILGVRRNCGSADLLHSLDS